MNKINKEIEDMMEPDRWPIPEEIWKKIEVVWKKHVMLKDAVEFSRALLNVETVKRDQAQKQYWDLIHELMPEVPEINALTVKRGERFIIKSKKSDSPEMPEGLKRFLKSLHKRMPPGAQHMGTFEIPLDPDDDPLGD